MLPGIAGRASMRGDDTEQVLFEAYVGIPRKAVRIRTQRKEKAFHFSSNCPLATAGGNPKASLTAFPAFHLPHPRELWELPALSGPSLSMLPVRGSCLRYPA